MTAEKIKILNDLKHNLSVSLRDNLKDVVLFGSQLTDDKLADADYDILIVVKERKDWKLERLISDICYEIDLRYNIITDTHVLGENELDTVRGKQPVFINALNEGYHA